MNKPNSTTEQTVDFSDWAQARGLRERQAKDAADKLLLSMRTTAKCRYNASVRLQMRAKVAFFTTAVLSLGLVFIPLMQNAAVPLAFQPNVLNMMQIFLGVAVLVYSVVIGTARYEVRATQLNECGNKLKELIRELDKERENYSVGSLPAVQLAEFQKRYADIVADVENHTRNDYRFATLEMIPDYVVSGWQRMQVYLEAQSVRAFGFVLPLLLILTEAVFVTDMIGATEIFTPYLNGKAVSQRLANPSGGLSKALRLQPEYVR